MANELFEELRLSLIKGLKFAEGERDDLRVTILRRPQADSPSNEDDQPGISDTKGYLPIDPPISNKC